MPRVDGAIVSTYNCMSMDIIQLFTHLDKQMAAAIAAYGSWTYALLSLIVFVETGVVVMPFLPGDSLLFAAGAFAGTGALDLLTVIFLLSIAAIAGDSVNYAIGRRVGPAILARNGRFVKPEHLERTRAFYEKHGRKTIIIARFVPVVRTIAPFVAGIGQMPYRAFLAYNILGGIAWVSSLTIAGYWFGGIPFVREHFTAVVLVIVVISVLPGVIEYFRHRREQSFSTPPAPPL